MVKDPGVVLRESILSFLFTWGILEALCFWLLPFIGIVKFKAIEGWFIPTILAGLIGSLMAAVASSGIASTQKTLESGKQKRGRAISGIVGTIGFLGVIFPLILGGIFFAQAVSSTDWDKLFNDKPVLDQLTK